MRNPWIVCILAACGSPAATQREQPTTVEQPTAVEQLTTVAPALRPEPGADLDGAIAAPVRGKRVAHGPAAPIDFTSDRAPVAVRAPSPPRGGATTFTFADANGGDQRRGWVARIPEANQLPSVAYGNGRVYVSGGFESVSMYALDSEEGNVLWSSQSLEDNGPTAPIYEDEDIIFNTESCTLFVMDARTGRKKWFKYLGDPTLAQPAVADGLVFAQHPGGSGSELSAYKLRNGAEAWTRSIDGELLAAPIIHGDSVYFSTVGGTTYRYVRASGKRVWAKHLRATSAPWVVGPELFLSRRGKGVEEQIVVDAADGEVLRTHRTTKADYLADVPASLDDWKKVWAFEGSRPVVVDGTRYEAMGGLVQASDATTGDAFWTRRYAKGEGKRSTGTVVVAGPQVVLATRDGKLFGLDVDTGYTLWSYDVGHPVVAQPIVAKGWVYVTTIDGTIVGLDVADTTLDGWHMWGGNPQHDGLVARPAA
jgi:outer membrane protein assembly factor BamB